MALEVEASFLVGHDDIIFESLDNKVIIEIVVVGHAFASDGGGAFAANVKFFVEITLDEAVKSEEFLFFVIGFSLPEEVEEAKKEGSDD